MASGRSEYTRPSLGRVPLGIWATRTSAPYEMAKWMVYSLAFLQAQNIACIQDGLDPTMKMLAALKAKVPDLRGLDVQL